MPGVHTHTQVCPPKMSPDTADRPQEARVLGEHCQPGGSPMGAHGDFSLCTSFRVSIGIHQIAPQGGNMQKRGFSPRASSSPWHFPSSSTFLSFPANAPLTSGPWCTGDPRSTCPSAWGSKCGSLCGSCHWTCHIVLTLNLTRRATGEPALLAWRGPGGSHFVARSLCRSCYPKTQTRQMG